MSFLPKKFEDHRPWGSEECFTQNDPSTVKLLHVDAGKRFSLQSHEHRSEFWKVVQGSGIAHIGDEEKMVNISDELEIPVGTLHRLTGGPDGIIVLEISIGEFDEKDIHRFEDDFGRT